MVLSKEHLTEELKRLLTAPPTPAAVAAVTSPSGEFPRDFDAIDVLKEQVAEGSADIEELKGGQQDMFDMMVDLTTRLPQLIEEAVTKCWAAGADTVHAVGAASTEAGAPTTTDPQKMNRRQRRSVQFARQKSSSSSSESDSGSESSSESDKETEGPANNVNVVTTKKTLKKKGIRPKQQKLTDQLPEETKAKLREQDTLEGVKEAVRELVEWRKEEERRRKELTEAEKEMTKAELLRRQAELNYEKRYGPRDNSNLTEEEKAMSRPELLRKLRSEDHQRWVARQARLGRKIVKCQCGGDKVEGANHYCAKLWTGATRRTRGVPVQEEVIAKQQGRGGLHISRQLAVDEERLRREHAEMTKTIEKLDAAKVQDHPMTGSSSSSVNMVATTTKPRTGEQVRSGMHTPVNHLFHH
jgi:hypothetical protein